MAAMLASNTDPTSNQSRDRETPPGLRPTTRNNDGLHDFGDTDGVSTAEVRERLQIAEAEYATSTSRR
jgi:hypothetical protein